MRHHGQEVTRSPEEAAGEEAVPPALLLSPPSTTREGDTKRCSGEFEFKKK